MKIILGDTLKKINKSQYWLSKETGISASALNNLCNGKTKRVDFVLLDKICETLNCSVSDIIESEAYSESSGDTHLD